MRFTKAPLEGVRLIEPQVFQDPRGFFLESYREDLFKAEGIRARFSQDNHSSSSKGVLRGLHFQVPPFAQAKLVRITKGSAFDVVVDIRKNSPTFGKSYAVTLSAENKKMLYIPEGFAHGFLALEDNTEFLYKVSSVYSPAHEKGIFWNDPALGISWPSMDSAYTLSPKDQQYPKLSQAGLQQFDFESSAR